MTDKHQSKSESEKQVEVWTHGCDYTRSYLDEPNSIICIHVDETGGRMCDVDQAYEGISESEIFPPCPNCNWDRFVEETREDWQSDNDSVNEKQYMEWCFKFQQTLSSKTML